ncbi:MAG: hypothetical protein K2H08_09525, partial [Duncaniella sp.]|nr:hypothetical protein [Duncaniella sp.]
RQGLLATFKALCAIRADYPALFREDATSNVELSSPTARYISLTDGTSELYLVVNPASAKITESATIPFPTNPATGTTAFLSDTKYTMLAASTNVTPSMTANGLTLPAGTFAVYVSGPKSGIDDIITDSAATSRPVVVNDGGYIRVLSPHTSVAIYTLGGMSIPTGSRLSPGIYIVVVDSNAVKVAVM